MKNYLNEYLNMKECENGSTDRVFLLVPLSFIAYVPRLILTIKGARVIMNSTLCGFYYFFIVYKHTHTHTRCLFILSMVLVPWHISLQTATAV